MKVRLPIFLSQCGSVKELLWEYAGERLSEGPMEMVEHHLEACARCRREVDSLRRSQKLLAAYRQVEPVAPRSDWSALRERLLRENPGAAQSGRHPGKTAYRGGEDARKTLRYREWLPALASVGVLGVALVIVALSSRGTRSSSAGVPLATRQLDSSARDRGESQPVANPITSVALNWGQFLNVPLPARSPSSATPHRDRPVHRETTQESKVRVLLAKNTTPTKPRTLHFSPTDIRQQERPQNSVPTNANANEFQAVSTQQHFVMGTLEPTSHEDDSTY